MDYVVTKHDIEIRRYLAWRKTVRGKTIPIRLYEIIYVGLVMLWSKMDKPPLKTAIYKFVKRKEYKEELMSGQLFQKLISEIRETPCEDGTGYYHSDSREQLTYEDVEQLKKRKRYNYKKNCLQETWLNDIKSFFDFVDFINHGP